ncbi:hypothetical protein GCM10022395_23810 [Snuella lapsa]|uniref:Uncharacterized protein n=1 Tax=Snuella lapsa TaxID=870481 RepID=A0ABP6XYC4_9FLAO
MKNEIDVIQNVRIGIALKSSKFSFVALVALRFVITYKFYTYKSKYKYVTNTIQIRIHLIIINMIIIKSPN